MELRFSTSTRNPPSKAALKTSTVRIVPPRTSSSLPGPSLLPGVNLLVDRLTSFCFSCDLFNFMSSFKIMHQNLGDLL